MYICVCIPPPHTHTHIYMYTHTYICLYVYLYMQNKLQLFWCPQRYWLLWAIMLIPFSWGQFLELYYNRLTSAQDIAVMSWLLPGCYIVSFFPTGASDTESVSLLSWLLATWFYTGQGVGGTLQGCGRLHFRNMKLKTKLHKTWGQESVGLGWPPTCVSAMDPSP